MAARARLQGQPGRRAAPRHRLRAGGLPRAGRSAASGSTTRSTASWSRSTTTSVQQALGVVGREPRWAIAFKFAPTTAVTKLREIEVNVGRTGNMMPFAMLEPVQVGGVTVSKATLHNEEDIARKDIREGDEVVIMRAGDVIPQVVSPITQRRTGKEKHYRPPKKCPACGTTTVKPEGEVWTRCPNRCDCPGQILQALKHFSSKRRDGHRGLRREARLPLLRRGARALAARHLPPDRRAAGAARGLPAQVGREPGRTRSSARSGSRSTACCTRSASRASAA